MQEVKIYEYAVIRLVPKVEREEFFNIGLVMFSKREKYIRVDLHLCPIKFDLMKCEMDKEAILQNLENFRHVANGDKAGGENTAFDIPERFRWLTSVPSSVIQTSRLHPRKTTDLGESFERLFNELVK